MEDNNNNNLPALQSNSIAESMPVSVDSLTKQVAAIQKAMQSVMQKDVHYGVIQGCGDKPSLLKPGAEKIGLMFRLGAFFDIKEKELPNNHREYFVTCTLKHTPTGQIVGQGVGSCSTMETKYRYAGSETQRTSIEVPKDFWEDRNKRFLVEATGGQVPAANLTFEKDDNNKWMICIKGDKKERKDVADVHNTCLKMGKKRAHVDAIITATAAGDIFTQDIEEMELEERKAATATNIQSTSSHSSNIVDAEVVQERKATPATPKAKPASGATVIYDLPFKAEGFNMADVRDKVKRAGFRFDSDTKRWKGSEIIEGLDQFLVGGKSAAKTAPKSAPRDDEITDPRSDDELPPPFDDDDIPF